MNPLTALENFPQVYKNEHSWKFVLLDRKYMNMNRGALIKPSSVQIEKENNLLEKQR